MKSKILLFLFALSISLCYGQRTTVQDLVIKKSISQSGVCTVSSFSIDQNNLAIDNGCHIYKISASTPITLSGIVAQTGGRTIKLINTSVNAITLPHESSSSTAANRFSIAGQGQVVMGQNSTVELWYDDSTSRWIVMSANVSVIETVPAPSAVTGLTSSAVTSNSATISWDPCEDCDFVLVTMRNPDSNPLDPTDNVSYSASSVFGSGDQIGENNYVIHNGTGTSVDVTGLGIVTPYSLRAYAYNQNGGTINYDKTLITSSAHSFTTLASATTPTTPYTITSVLTKEDSVIITGTAGNGTNRAVLMAENKEVDDFFVDDQSYSADDFGQGDEIGTGNFVVFDGTTESPLRLAGFERDKEYSNPYIAEYTSDKYLLPPANGPPEFPDLLRTAWIYDEEFATGSGDPGLTFLTTDADVHIYYDLTALVGSDEGAISNGNTGLNDLSTGGTFDATIVGTPTIETITVGGESRNTLSDVGTNAVNTNNDGSTTIGGDGFENWIYLQMGDGIPSASTDLTGAHTSGSNHRLFIQISTAGKLIFLFQASGTAYRWDSNAAVFTDGVNGPAVLRVRYDHTGNAFTVEKNGASVPGTVISGTISGNDPDNWAGTEDIYVGSLNTAGTASSNPTENSIIKYAFTNLLTTQEASEVLASFNYTAGDDFEDWIVHETSGFDWSVSNDSLILSGNPAGFQDYVYYKDVVPDSLQEFNFRKIVTINDDLASGDSGIGLMLINDLDNEANRGVVGLFVTNPASGNFGKAQIYSGDGTVAAPSTFPFRSQSSGTFIPEKDSSYVIALDRDIQGNNVLYSFSVTDLYDSVVINTAWTEPNRTSDQYYGATIKTAIYINGGPFRIKDFVFRRTGLEAGGGGGEEPPPPIFDADLFVSKSGSSDANDCGESDPCLTLNRTLQRAAELSPTVQDIFVGAGTYAETSFLNPPSNTGEVRGAGRNLTFITGASNLYTSTTVSNPGRSSDSRALITLNNLGDVDIKFSSMSFMGNKNNGGTTNSIRHGFVINNTDGVILEDVAIRFFNTTGLKLGNVDDFRMENFYMESTAGEQLSSGGGGFTYYQVQTFNIGGGTPIEDGPITDLSETNYRIIFKDGLIEGTKSLFDGDAWSDGAGWGLTGGGSSDTTRYSTNVLWDNVEFNINKKGVAIHNGHRFNIEGLYQKTGNMLLKDCKFNNNLSWGGMSDINSTLGWTRITGCTFTLNPDPPTFVMEMQISYCEIDNNFVNGARSGVFTSLNDQDQFSSQTAMFPVVRGDHGHWDIHHNIIRLGTANNYGMFGGANWELHDYKIRNNTIDFTTTQSLTSNPNWYAIFTDNNAGSVSTGLVYENNAFVGIPPSPSQFWDGGGMSGGIHRYNKSGRIGSTGNPFVVTATRSGVTSSNNQIHGTGSNSLGLGLGTPPTTWDEAFNGDYYRPQAGSVLIDAGQGSVTIGALEED